MAPTVMTLEAAPGEPMVDVPGPLLPAATVTTMPASHAALTFRDVESVPSEGAVFGIPMLSDMTLMPYVALFATTQSIPASILAWVDCPLQSITFTPTRAAPGATPR